MNVLLDAVEARVLGALVEKEITTPDYYPLSLNALVNACNQKSNREPPLELDEDAVRGALRTLDEKALARSAVSDGRVAKYEHQLQEAFNFTRPEIAVLCELLLRGPQTPGELRGRASRMYPFEDLEAVHSALQKLMKREPPLAKLLARQPGTKEARYAHLLAGDVEPEPVRRPAVADPGPQRRSDERIAGLEKEIADLKTEVSVLRSLLEDFGKKLP
jgi:uncharacterized protein YceH (UPF0502 family)